MSSNLRKPRSTKGRITASPSIRRFKQGELHELRQSVRTAAQELTFTLGAKSPGKHVDELAEHIDAKRLTRQEQLKIKLALKKRAADPRKFDRMFSELQHNGTDSMMRFLQIMKECVENKSIEQMLTDVTPPAPLPASTNRRKGRSTAVEVRPRPTQRNSSKKIDVDTPTFPSKRASQPSTTPTSGVLLTEQAVQNLSRVPNAGALSPLSPELDAHLGLADELEDNLHEQADTQEDNRDLIDLTYGSKVLLVGPNGTCASIDEKQRFVATTQMNAQEFVILPYVDDAKKNNQNSDEVKLGGPVRLQSMVQLLSESGNYISAEGAGALSGNRTDNRTAWKVVGVRKSPYQQMLSLADLTEDQEVEGVVKMFDRICLMSIYTTYLTIDENGKPHCNGADPIAANSWQITQASLPFVPDWARYRNIELRRPHFQRTTVPTRLPQSKGGPHLKLKRKPKVHDALDTITYDYGGLNEDDLRQLEEEEAEMRELEAVQYRGDPHVIHAGQTSKQQIHILNSYPSETQDSLLVEDVLFALMGIEGKFIHMFEATDNSVVFALPDSVQDESIVYVVNRILPLCGYYFEVSHFVDVHSRFEYGLVNHALCAAIRLMLKEYLILIAQLEHQFRKGKLTLQRLWFYIQPSLLTMERLHRLTARAGKAQATGGSLLNVISDVMASEGDGQAKALYVHLMSRAAAPYLTMLEQWIFQGVIRDPYEEFQIKARDDVSKENLKRDLTDNYWDLRYTLRTEKMPKFLEKVADKILTTGKYLNVIRECGRGIDCPFEDKVRFTTNQREYVEIIERAHRFASRKLLDLLLKEYQLVDRLRSIKRYFLLDQGDFFVHFLDTAEDELEKHRSDISINKLESLLELSLRTSIAVNDPFKDDLTCCLCEDRLLETLNAVRHILKKQNRSAVGDQSSSDSMREKGINVFSFHYVVRWPVTLIISGSTLTKYRLIFRHLLQCKNAERALCKTWMWHQTCKELDLRDLLAASHSLRHRMLNFLQNLSYYMMVEVLEPNWHEFEAKLKTIKTVDDLLSCHAAFLNKCMDECLLNSDELMQTLYKMLSSCHLFANNLSNWGQTIEQTYTAEPLIRPNSTLSPLERRRARIKEVSAFGRTQAAASSFMTMIASSTKTFDDHITKFISDLNSSNRATSYDNHLANLANRLDWNGYYQQKVMPRRTVPPSADRERRDRDRRRR